MSGINKVILVGNLGNDPEIKYTAGGTPMARFSIATSEQWTDKASGEKKERTEWHRIIVWNKLAELCGQYLQKGRQVYIEGNLQTRSWDDKDGIKRYTTEVRAQTIQFLGGSPTHKTDPSTLSGPGTATPATDDPFSGDGGALTDQDIPF